MANLTAVDSQHLVGEGFTRPGIDHFTKTVTDYGDQLLRRTTLKADAERVDSQAREVTSSHVRTAAREIASRPSTIPPSGWSIAGQVSEYLFAAGAGVGAGHLDKTLGIFTFGGCLTFATILLVARLARRSGK